LVLSVCIARFFSFVFASLLSIGETSISRRQFEAGNAKQAIRSRRFGAEPLLTDTDFNPYPADASLGLSVF
jgi:hypothetical protein